MTTLTLLWWLILGHFVADYPLQSDFMAKEKNPWRPLDLSRVPPGQLPQTFWPWVLSAHAGVHAAAIGVITGSLTLSVLEFAAHWFIDLGKCRNLYGIHVDQALHLTCKVAWVSVVVVSK